MALLDTATANLSIGNGSDHQRIGVVDTSQTSVETPIKKWTPRWKTDTTVKPTAYDDGSQGVRNGGHRACGATYHLKAISERLHCQGSHSFMTVQEPDHAEEGPTSSSSGNAPGTIVAIIYHQGANPEPFAEKGCEIWTRNSWSEIVAQVGQPLPLFTYFERPKHLAQAHQRRTIFYRFAGTYSILSTAMIEPNSQELIEFVRKRGISQKDAPAEVWRDKLNAEWMKVVVRRCAEDQQLPDPMSA